MPAKESARNRDRQRFLINSWQFIAIKGPSLKREIFIPVLKNLDFAIYLQK